MRDFPVLQQELFSTWTLGQQPGGGEHVRVILPSYNVGRSALRHYARRLPALEHRFLVEILQLSRAEGCEMVFVLCQAPDEDVIEYYLSLLPPEAAAGVRDRIHTVVVPDSSARPIAAKLLDRPDLVEQIRRRLAGRPAYIEPWNVTEEEVAVALRLQAPLNGTAPDLWQIGFKSAGRRLFAAAGVPTPLGVEDVRSLGGVRQAIAALQKVGPRPDAVVVKLDNSVAGDGNRIVRLADEGGRRLPSRAVAEQVDAFPDWYRAELATGAVVEAYVSGDSWSSPSVQVEITPDGRSRVLATHEQVLGGDNGQVYLGCRFPARRDYANRLTRYGLRVGELLARRGALGMLSVDFVAARDGHDPWRLYALEVNLRRGGTTPPIVVLSSLLPGTYDARGRWRLPDGSARYYCATDNLVDPRWVGLPPGRVIEGVATAGLAFDRRTGTGVVLHMLSGIAIDGRFGLTAVGVSAREARQMFAGVGPVVDRLYDEWTAERSPAPRIPRQLRPHPAAAGSRQTSPAL